MSKEDLDDSVANQSLLDIQPNENASLYEWRDWALRLSAHLRKLEIEIQNRKNLKEN